LFVPVIFAGIHRRLLLKQARPSDPGSDTVGTH
jgi:hypothetical protein